MDELLDRLWFADFEVFAHDWLLVCINYRTHEEKVFHNTPRNDIFEWLNKDNPILCGYNFAYYDKFILKGILSGFNCEEVKKLNDFIILEGGYGKDYYYGDEYVKLPPIWDLMQDIVPAKSLKEIEGNLGLDITETTIPFDLPTRWTEEEYQEVLFYCRADVNALFPLFEKRIDYYDAKFVISEMGNIDPIYGMSITNAALTSIFLDAKRVERDDKNDYTYPSNFELEKIDERAKKYFDEFINGERDIDDEKLELDIEETKGNIGAGGIHLAINNYIFESDKFNASDYKEADNE